MPTITGADAHVDVPLSNLAVEAFSAGDDEFIGDQVFPMVDVGKQSDKYYIIEKAAFLRDEDALRAEKTKARRIEFTVNSDRYFADNYALASENPLEVLSNADVAIRLRENSTKLVVGRLRRAQEIRVANAVTSATNLGSGVALTGTAKWTDFINSDPIGDVTTGHATIKQVTGLVANTMIMDWDTMMVVRRHPDLLDMFKYTSGGMLNQDQLGSVFGVSRMLIGQGVKENALEGATSSITNIWGNNVILAHIEPGTGLQTRTLGLRFQWRPAGFPGPMQVERQVEKGAGSRKVEIIEAGHFQDEKIVASELGYAITGTL